MKLTCVVIVAVFLTADDSKYALERLFPESRDEMKDPEALASGEKRACLGLGQVCAIPFIAGFVCCSGLCLVLCS
nr:conotoxin precursor O1 [Conus judaeus]